MIDWKALKDKILDKYFDEIEYDEDGNEIIVNKQDKNDEKDEN